MRNIFEGLRHQAGALQVQPDLGSKHPPLRFIVRVSPLYIADGSADDLLS